MSGYSLTTVGVEVLVSAARSFTLKLLPALGYGEWWVRMT